MVKQYLINEGFALRTPVPEARDLNNPTLSRQAQCGDLRITYHWELFSSNFLPYALFFGNSFTVFLVCFAQNQ